MLDSKKLTNFRGLWCFLSLLGWDQ